MSEHFARVWRQSIVAVFLVLGAPTLIGGCSFMAVQPARKDDRGQLEPAGCTTRMTAPAADGIITGGLLVGTLTVGSQTSSDDQIMVGLVLAALFGLSAIYGAVTVDSCRGASGMLKAPKKTSDERRAEEAAEEAAVQARLKAKAAADVSAAGASATADGGAPVPAPNQ